jgi:hypothetical protein
MVVVMIVLMLVIVDFGHDVPLVNHLAWMIPTDPPRSPR